MRIAYINCAYGAASTGRLVADLVNYGNAHGHECIAFYSEWHSDAPEAHRYIRDGERNVHALLSRISGLQGYWGRIPTRRLITALKEFSPDIVHMHVVHGNCLDLSMLFDYLQREHICVVITLHDCWWFTGRCVHPTEYGCTKFETDCKGCPAKNDVCPSWFFDRAAKMLDDKRRWLTGVDRLAVIGVSKWISAQAKKSFIPDDAIHTIYNWVDTDVFRPRESGSLRESLGLVGKKIVLGVANIWEARKGLADFIALADMLPEEYHIVLVGKLDGSHLPTRITHIPHTDSKEQLAELYSMADVFVNPSKAETFGLTTAEALACGTPAVVYDVAACPELLSSDTGCVVAPALSVSGLLDAVRSIHKDARCSNLCQLRIETVFSLKHGCEEYYMTYNEIQSK